MNNVQKAIERSDAYRLSEYYLKVKRNWKVCFKVLDRKFPGYLHTYHVDVKKSWFDQSAYTTGEIVDASKDIVKRIE